MFFRGIFLLLLWVSQVPISQTEEQDTEKKVGEVKSGTELHFEHEKEDEDFKKIFLGPRLPPKTVSTQIHNITIVSVIKNVEEVEEEEEDEDAVDEEEGSKEREVKKDNEKNIIKDPVPTTAPATTPPPLDDNISYVLSRIAALESAIHRLNVQFYGMDVKMNQMSQSLSKIRTKLSEAEDTITTVSELNSKNQRQIGHIEGCLKGKRLFRRCYLIFQHFENYATAQQNCHTRGGNLAMPTDQQEFAALAQYIHNSFFPFNWPIWIGINDLRAEGMYLYENGHRVSFFNWYKDHMVTQPNGGIQENCVSVSSDDGKWWDNDCSRRMYYVCEY
ncbi:C-type lectin domain family 11 member A [Pelobates fuscus]|uniref:C-type lectin domain family 11 member A n=1 Tax=Pelobates fuscus TaxID=191477 RepID=UPI002FE4F84B